MTSPGRRQLLYWDASAIVAIFVREPHSEAARSRFSRRDSHLCSTVAYAEACAAILRSEREGILTLAAAGRAFAALDGPKFEPCAGEPSRRRVKDIARRHTLRGADLWHLAFALDLRAIQPHLCLLTFDAALSAAAAAEGIVAERAAR